jgi:hypothetical protein
MWPTSAWWERKVAEVLVVGVIANKTVGARDILPVKGKIIMSAISIDTSKFCKNGKG